MKRHKFYNILLISLIAITCITMLLQVFALERTLLVSPGSNENITVITDESLNGQSTAKLTVEKEKWLLDCYIQESEYRWPFCEISLKFFDNNSSYIDQGIDLSSFSSIHIKARYLNNSNIGIRFNLRSFNPEYSHINNDQTWKYVGIEYWPNDNSLTTKIPMKSLQVATWWLIEQKIPIEFSAPEFNKVMVIEVATGNNIKSGHYLLELESIMFTGKFYSNSQVYFVIIILWVLAAIFALILNLKDSRNRLSATRQKAVELQKLNQLLNVETKVLKDKAERDPLTGALNRSGIKAVFTLELKILSLIFIDIDHFKTINDIHGHLIGDEILKEFVKTISENCRNTDFIARWGGEEFLLVCPNTVLSDAYELAQTLRKIIDEKTWVNQIKLTSSFGVAQRGDESSSDFIERTDKALYDAKVRGRNQVVLSKLTDHLNPLI